MIVDLENTHIKLVMIMETCDEFMQYQVKIVMMSNNSSKPPMFKDLRVIALAT